MLWSVWLRILAPNSMILAIVSEFLRYKLPTIVSAKCDYLLPCLFLYCSIKITEPRKAFTFGSEKMNLSFLQVVVNKCLKV
jgi:hypothetical protein